MGLFIGCVSKSFITKESMKWKNIFSFIIFLLLLNVITGEAVAQTRMRGVVTDSLTGEALPFISIQVKGTAFGTMTDNSGKFYLSVPAGARQLSLSSIGYKDKTVQLQTVKGNYIKIRLAATGYNISEVVIKPHKRKYTKKGNPAVEFVRRVIASKDRFNPLNKPYYRYEHDEEINIALNNFQKEKNKKLLNKYGFLTDYIDTSTLSGKPILPVSSKEIIEDYYYQRSPRLEKRIVIAKKNAGIEQMLPEEGVDQVLGEVFKDVDIYENNITLFLRPFVSPLSSGAPDFYKFYLLDTLVVASERCAELGFVPFSSQSPGFTGHMYITLDGTYFVKKVRLNFPKDINLNFIQDMSIGQEFNRAPDGTRLLMRDDMEVEFSVLSVANGFYARRTNRYTQHSFEPPGNMAVFKELSNRIIATGATSRPDSFWVTQKVDSSYAKKKTVANMLVQLRKDPLYYISEKVFAALVTGYIETSAQHNKVTLGPIYSTLSSNTAEGVRIRMGGITTANLNDHLFGKGYVAYGTVDRKFKYLAEMEYSFAKKQKLANEYPVHSIWASYSYDVNRLGQHYTTSADNVLLSLKRQDDNKITYQRKIEVNYNRELYSQLSYGVDVRHHTEYATQYLPFVDNVSGNSLGSYAMGEAEFRIRYAPGERIYQTPTRRYAITRNAPVFSLSHTLAFKGLMGSDYNYSRTEFAFQKRFWFSLFGNANVIVRAGKVWSKNPFPMLIIPHANLSYIVQYDTYPMMNATEFINDQYVSWDLNYNMKGLLLNRIPLIQYLKLREILSFRGMYGSLKDMNDPSFSNGLYRFPAGTYRMGKDPYLEAGVGVENIFKILRVDYVWRLTYLNHPGIDKTGIRIVLDFGF